MVVCNRPGTSAAARWNTVLISILSYLLIGALAGWLAGQFVRGGSFGLFGNIIVGVLGAMVGGLLLGLLGIAFGGFVGSLVTATLGAALLLWLVGMLT